MNFQSSSSRKIAQERKKIGNLAIFLTSIREKPMLPPYLLKLRIPTIKETTNITK